MKHKFGEHPAGPLGDPVFWFLIVFAVVMLMVCIGQEIAAHQ